MDPDPGGPKIYGSGSGILVLRMSLQNLMNRFYVKKVKAGFDLTF
jgi:hypothetical protein